MLDLETAEPGPHGVEQERALHERASTLLRTISEFTRNVESENGRSRAWNAFRAWNEESCISTRDHESIFLAWYLFKAQPIAECPSRLASFAKIFANEMLYISPLDRSLIERAESAPIDFFEVHEIPNLNKFYLKSLCLGYRGSFSFFEPPLESRPGDIFLGKVIPIMEDKGILMAKGPRLSRDTKVSVASLRRSLIENRRQEFLSNFPLFEADIFDTNAQAHSL